MEIKISILKVLYIISWIIFIGVCIEAGGFIFNAFFTMAINPAGASYFWNRLDLSALYKYDRGYFLVITLIMSLVAIMRAMIFYLIIKILHDKKLDMSQPFNKHVERFISLVAYLALGICFFSAMGARYIQWLGKKGVEMPDIQDLSLDGADVWAFMGVTLFVVAQIFKKGIEIQRENELTI